ncbi:cytochrome C peroxidase [Terrimonas sp.]|uniref:cytochrome-c peroxidase n=1 Tax=Terrimonas sp. TaxID=1914338 RepID=UPI000D52336A|nr:cytochrome-c peroxidase [Terrimonas sp.]PVD49603.1 cytochrome C peroxidase [Terrimonas sp.]
MYKKIGIAGFLFMGIFIASFTPHHKKFYTIRAQEGKRERKIREKILNDIVSFRDYVKDSLLAESGKAHVDTQNIRRIFLQSRLLFKAFEWAAAYFAADLTDRLNGPPVQEIENADLLDSSIARAIDPMGLQVIEGYIYPIYDEGDKKELINEVDHLINSTKYLVSFFTDQQLADWRILDAAKLEIFRIIALGITGFDNPLSLKSMEESAAALKSLREMLPAYVKDGRKNTLLQELEKSINYLHQHTDFNAFDRANFISHYANSISTGIAELEQGLPGEKIKYNRMLNQEARTLFDTNAFNVDAFAPGAEFQTTTPKVLLGEKLFYDVSISGNGTRSCASCHRPELAFADGLPKNTNIHHPAKLLRRNTPTLINAALQSNYFYDMRALTLEEQIWDVIGNKEEMDGSMDTIVEYVSADKTYQSLFSKAFPGKKNLSNPVSSNYYSTNIFPENYGREINAEEVVNALAAYVRSLVKLNSRFDDYMQGNEQALSASELKGFNLFMGKAKCATCHFIPLFNGITPPKYVVSETEVLGVPLSLSDSTLDTDRGYYDVIGIDAYKYAFKIPSVRNVDKTSPYMHNGVYQTLDLVMDFYNNGGGAGLRINLPNQTLSKENLNLSEEEKKDIIGFMKSLESK